MNRFSIITITAAIFFACTGPAQSEGIDDVVARAGKLNEAGEPSEATAVLARAFSQQPEKVLLEEWLAIDEKRLADFESKIIHKQMPPLPSWESTDTASTVATVAVVAAVAVYSSADWRDWRRWVYGGPIGPPPVPTPTPVLVVETARQYDAAIKEQRKALEKHLPAILDENEVRGRLLAIDECFRSMNRCVTSVSSALQTAPVDKIEPLLALKNQAQSQIKRLRDMRALFVSYDHIAPRVIDAHIALVPDALGVTGAYVTAEALKRAAERLGECSDGLMHAHKDAKRLWLDALSKLKHASGAEQFKDLETLATTVGKSQHSPEEWEPQ